MPHFENISQSNIQPSPVVIMLTPQEEILVALISNVIVNKTIDNAYEKGYTISQVQQ